MRREMTVGVIVYAFVAISILLFPHWHWTNPPSYGDVFPDESQYSFISRPPAPKAYIVWNETCAWEGCTALLIASTIYVWQSRARDKKAAAQWRLKWDYAKNDPDSLLRASDNQKDAINILLRGTQANESVSPDQLLRSSELKTKYTSQD